MKDTSERMKGRKTTKTWNTDPNILARKEASVSN
jgi:hypothetical protein